MIRRSRPRAWAAFATARADRGAEPRPEALDERALDQGEGGAARVGDQRLLAGLGAVEDDRSRGLAARTASNTAATSARRDATVSPVRHGDDRHQGVEAGRPEALDHLLLGLLARLARAGRSRR